MVSRGRCPQWRCCRAAAGLHVARRRRCLLSRLLSVGAAESFDFKGFLLTRLQMKSGEKLHLELRAERVSPAFQISLINAGKPDPLPLLSVKECGGVGPLVQASVSPYSPADQQPLKGD